MFKQDSSNELTASVDSVSSMWKFKTFSVSQIFEVVLRFKLIIQFSQHL